MAVDESAPTIRLLKDGQRVPFGVMHDVVAVEYEDEVLKMSKLVITLGNPSITRSERNSGYEGFFKKDDTIVFQAGYMGRVKVVGGGIVESIRARFAEQTVQIECLGGGILLTKRIPSADPELEALLTGEDSHVFEGTDSEAATDIAKRHGFTTNITRTELETNRIRTDQTEYEFLQQVADENDFEFFVDLDPELRTWKLHFHPPNRATQSTSKVYRWNAGDSTTILNIDPFIAEEELDKKGFVRVTGFDKEQNLPIDLTEKIIPNRVETFRNVEFANIAEAERFIKSVAAQRNEAFVPASVQLRGDPDLRAGSVHTLSGLRTKYLKDLSGSYRFTSVTHLATNQGGYTNRCRVERLEKVA